MPNMTPAGYGAFSLTAMQHSVTLADTKAGFILAGSIAFLIFMAKEALRPGHLPPVTAIVAMFCFLATAVLAAMTLRPRFIPAPVGSLAYWRSTTFVDEATTISTASSADLGTQADRLVGAHLYGLASVCRSKYLTLNLAFWAAVVAVGAFLVWRAGDVATPSRPASAGPVEVVTEIRQDTACGPTVARAEAPGVKSSVSAPGRC